MEGDHLPAEGHLEVLGQPVQPPGVLDRQDVGLGHRLPQPRADVAGLLEPGTLRSAEEFSRCTRCGHVYWRGAHARRIDELIAAATHSRPG
ncbi:hypothetical protein A7K94_0214540 [Modestobacter sp. VKM Ac-2676]|nr:hypothetical protein A7K94_0214540 [Modestobacter sp. VKM Ac-2676]